MLYHRHRDAEHVGGLLAEARTPATVVADAWCGGCLRPRPCEGADRSGLGPRRRTRAGRLVGPSAPSALGEAWPACSTSVCCGSPPPGSRSAPRSRWSPAPQPRMDRVKDRGPEPHAQQPRTSTGDIAALTAELTAPDLEARTARLAAPSPVSSDTACPTAGSTRSAVPCRWSASRCLPDATRVVAALTARGVAALPVRSRCLRTDVLVLRAGRPHTRRCRRRGARSVGDLLAGQPDATVIDAHVHIGVGDGLRGDRGTPAQPRLLQGGRGPPGSTVRSMPVLTSDYQRANRDIGAIVTDTRGSSSPTASSTRLPRPVASRRRWRRLSADGAASASRCMPAMDASRVRWPRSPTETVGAAGALRPGRGSGQCRVGRQGVSRRGVGDPAPVLIRR